MKRFILKKTLRTPKLPERKALIERAPTGHLHAGYPVPDKYRNPFEIPERKEPALEMGGWWDAWFTASGAMEMRQWTTMMARISHAKDAFSQCMDIDPMIRSGVPVVKDTRMPVAMVLANVAAGMSLSEVADDFSLDKEKLVLIFQCLAIVFDRPANEHHSTRRMHEFWEVDEIVCPGGEDSNASISGPPGWPVD